MVTFTLRVLKPGIAHSRRATTHGSGQVTHEKERCAQPTKGLRRARSRLSLCSDPSTSKDGSAARQGVAALNSARGLGTGPFIVFDDPPAMPWWIWAIRGDEGGGYLKQDEAG